MIVNSDDNDLVHIQQSLHHVDHNYYLYRVCTMILMMNMTIMIIIILINMIIEALVCV